MGKCINRYAARVPKFLIKNTNTLNPKTVPLDFPVQVFSCCVSIRVVSANLKGFLPAANLREFQELTIDSTIDVDHLSRNVRGFFRAEKRDQMRHFIGSTKSIEWH